jgi:L-amino acid N-acyltransferase YncA
MGPTRIRAASVSDAAAMLEIYSPSITNGHASFEVVVPSVEEFQGRITSNMKKFPWLVYEVEGMVVGYAYASMHRSRCAYDWTVESSAYVLESHRKKQIGKMLYQKLFEIIKSQGVCLVLAGITLPNIASVKFHESLGFTPVGVYKNIGFKMNQWWDVGWWQLQLQKPTAPHPITPWTANLFLQ